VSTLKRRGTRAGNRIAVWMYRTLDGRFFSFSKDVHVLMVTTEVAKYARRAGRVIPVAVLEPIEGT